ncbi:hypothetical protein D7030_04245 [Flavobacteriaceae bacterium AU392]|nr:hypothetical protein D1817_10720 [Flavobacteriaceae bacterium]RKM85888.1 hypothetical protein D7030_04245 [Flavobacteriaceae bacterium AU392]
MKKYIQFIIISFAVITLCFSYQNSKKASISIKETITYSWKQTDSSITLCHQNKIVWQYNFKTQKGKPFFHPLNIDNITITELSPSDHPWHLGLWYSWKYINEINYWEYDQTENVAPWNYIGQTEIRDIKITPEKDFSCIVELDIAYHKLDDPDVLKEKRIIQISSPDENGLFTIDYEFKFTAIAETVKLDRTPLPDEQNGSDLGGYAGLSIRFNKNLTSPNYINSDDSNNMQHGKRGLWSYYGLKNQNNENIGVAIFDHSQSFNHPTPWYRAAIKNIPLSYMGTAPIFNKPHIMKLGETISFNYRLKLYKDKPPYKLLQQDWNDYVN